MAVHDIPQPPRPASARAPHRRHPAGPEETLKNGFLPIFRTRSALLRKWRGFRFASFSAPAPEQVGAENDEASCPVREALINQRFPNAPCLLSQRASISSASHRYEPAQIVVTFEEQFA